VLRYIFGAKQENKTWRKRYNYELCVYQTKETKLRVYNITAKAALKFGSEAWVPKKREEQRLEAAQMKFLRHLLGIRKLDKEKKTNVLGKKQEQRI